MTEVLKNIVSFFKTRLITAKISPNIEIDYSTYYFANKDVALSLAEGWKKLRVELDNNPGCIKEQKWNDFYSDGTRTEKLTVDIEGVVMTLTGPHEPNPNFKKPPAEPVKSEEQRANEALDQLIQSTSVIWAITHCSDIKHDAFIQFLNANRTTTSRKGGAV